MCFPPYRTLTRAEAIAAADPAVALPLRRQDHELAGGCHGTQRAPHPLALLLDWRIGTDGDRQQVFGGEPARVIRQDGENSLIAMTWSAHVPSMTKFTIGLNAAGEQICRSFADTTTAEMLGFPEGTGRSNLYGRRSLPVVARQWRNRRDAQ
jgi:hypothetical protein